MLDEIFKKLKKNKKSNCLTVVRGNCEVFDNFPIIKRKNQTVIVSEKTELSNYFVNLKGLNIRERQGLGFYR